MILYILLIAHFLADFTLQTDQMAKRKKTEPSYLLLHCGIYAAVMTVVCCLCLEPVCGVGAGLVLALSHYLIDAIRSRFGKVGYTFHGFLADQVLHIALIFQMSHLLGTEAVYSAILRNAMSAYPVEQILRYVLLFIVIMDPASVFVKLLTATISTGGEEQDPGPANVGKLIGILERLIIAFLVLADAFGSIGFVMTAKSLARYKELNDKKFAEVYLVGTLSSIAIAIAVTYLLKP